MLKRFLEPLFADLYVVRVEYILCVPPVVSPFLTQVGFSNL